MHQGYQLTSGSPRIAYESHGQGAPIVFVHGVGGNLDNWRDQLEHFGRDRRAVALDLRGYGHSDDIPGTLDFHDFAADVLAVMDTLGLARAPLVGLSMGGLVVQSVYARAPERVSALVLAACRPADAPVAHGEQFARDRLAPLDSERPQQALADSLLPKLMGPATAPGIVARLRDSLLRLRLDQYRQVVPARTQLPPYLALADIRVPTLVLGGRQDQLAPVGQMQAIARAIAGSELDIFENCGHFLNIEQASAFNARLRAFLDAVAGRAPSA